jgi:hypothetical protein
MPRHLTTDDLSIQWSGDEVSQDDVINFVGDGVVIVDDDANDQTLVTIDSTGGGSVVYRTINYYNGDSTLTSSGVVDFGTLYDPEAEYGDPFLDTGVGQTDATLGRFVFSQDGVYEIAAQIARIDVTATYTFDKRIALRASTDDPRHPIRRAALMPSYGVWTTDESFWAQLMFTDFMAAGTVLTIDGIPGYSYATTHFLANIVLTQMLSAGA